MGSVEVSIQKLVDFLNETLPIAEQFTTNDNIELYLSKREQHFVDCEKRIDLVMEKKAVKLNSIRRNSFAFAWKNQ